MVQVCPPDEHGYVSLGTSVDATLAAIETSDYTIAVINKNVPRALGDAMIPLSMIDIFVKIIHRLNRHIFQLPMKLKLLLVNIVPN